MVLIYIAIALMVFQLTALTTSVWVCGNTGNRADDIIVALSWFASIAVSALLIAQVA